MAGFTGVAWAFTGFIIHGWLVHWYGATLARSHGSLSLAVYTCTACLSHWLALVHGTLVMAGFTGWLAISLAWHGMARSPSGLFTCMALY